ncbi:MAG TPA: LuxR C-terminal-related transcriptional regulator [Mycobacteriales bacterium]|nr:LuxR C-terminal-related transcriptional regulator [Mycobacteriales bacterium]
MIRWGEEVLGTLDAAVARAAGGTPTVLVVEGAAGLGKSTLLDTVGERAAGFTWLATEALETSAALPYDVLAGLGVDPTAATASGQLTTVLAAQRLRARIDDELSGDNPLLVTIDDLQWADSESVEALLAVVSRSAGDRVLIALASRALDAGQHPGWRRWSARPGRVERIELAGLSETLAVELVCERRPDIDRVTAARLWEHTAGNPLYLFGLVNEYAAGDLAQMRELPAPAEFSQWVTDHVAGLPEPARRLAAALSVLGGDWWPLRDAATVAGLSEPTASVTALVDAGLAESRPTATGEQMRLAHSLIRAATYRSLTASDRQTLHSRASAVVSGTSAALEHRAAAITGYDEDLAAELDSHAVSLRNQLSYRLAAHFHRLASAVTGDPAQRERLRLESLLDTLSNGDRATVRDQLDELDQLPATPLRDLVLAQLAQWERRARDAVTLLTPRSSPQPVAADAAWTQHRIEALLAWSRLSAGEPEKLIEQALTRMRCYDSYDPTFTRLAILTGAQLSARHASTPDQVAGLTELPNSPGAVPADQTLTLGWRGLVRSNTGQFALAVADLTEMTDRMQHGLADFGGGTYHAALARAQWFAGDWAMSRVNMRLALELGGDWPAPLLLVSAALPAIGVGDFDAADEAIATGRDITARSPWLEAVDQLWVVEVIRQHASGTIDAGLHSQVREPLEKVRRGELTKNLVWHVHAGLAAVWARALDDAALCAQRLSAAAGRTDWSEAASAWVRGLAAEANGGGKTALAALRAATAQPLQSMPLYGAHIHVDHARVAHLMNDSSAAARSLELASTTYQQLGAASYLRHVDEIRKTTAAIKTATLSLSDRERDVLALVTSGMSYAQIARNLFITQSTVGYHLGNIYAKADVSSRHELTELARQSPGLFGLPATA